MGICLDLESEAGHAALVLLDHGLALLGGIVGFGEEHAVIASGLLVLADAAGLKERCVRLGLCFGLWRWSRRTLGFSVWAGWALGSAGAGVPFSVDEYISVCYSYGSLS